MKNKVAITFAQTVILKFSFSFYNFQPFGLDCFLFEKDTLSGVKEFNHYSRYLVLFCKFLTQNTCVTTVSI